MKYPREPAATVAAVSGRARYCTARRATSAVSRPGSNRGSGELSGVVR